MSMPAEVLMLRHGESEGNVVVQASRAGDDSLMTDEFFNQHSSRWRLSEKGCQQAIKTGLWLREHFPDGFYRYYVSEYARALETAGLLDLPDSQWLISPYLRERWRGDLDRLPATEGEKLYQRSLMDKKTSPYYWHPPNGESLVEVSARLRIIIETMHRECPGKKVLMVCHGEIMEAMQIELLQLREHHYIAQGEAEQVNPDLKIKNCQIFHYSRHQDANNTSSPLLPYLNWFRSINPANNHFGPWQKINREKYDSQQLLQLAATSPKLLS